MITVNLLPEEFRVQEKKAIKIPGMQIVLGVTALFVLLTIYFYFDYLRAKTQLAEIQKEWTRVQPQSQELVQLEKEVQSTLKPERDFLAAFVTTEKPLTYVLQWVSEFLPPTAWLQELKLERSEKGENLFIKGLAVPSKEKSSIEQIEDYLNLLKAKMPDATLSLTTTRQKQDNFELTQFIANFQWGGTPNS